MKVACFVSILASMAGSAVEAKKKRENKKSGFTLQILHSSDNESGFVDINTFEEKIIHYAALAQDLKKLAEKEKAYTLHLTAGDHTIPGPFYKASKEVEYLGKPGLADILMFNAMGLTANGIGNHEFDGGIDQFADMLSTANYPFISANLDFSEAEVSETSAPITIVPDAGPCMAARGAVTKSCYIKLGKDVTVGIIGRAPADFFNVIANPPTTIPGIDFVGGRDPATNQPLVSAVDQVLEQVDLLQEEGAKVIILLDHAQDFTSDPLSASSLRGIDLIVAAGSTGFVGMPTPTGPFNLLREGDVPSQDYPIVREDMEGNQLLVVNSDQLYRYIGHLLVKFDKEGKLVSWDARSGPIATTAEAVGLLAKVVKGKNSKTNKGLKTVRRTLDDLLATPTITADFEVIGTTSEALNGARADVRTKETNLGRLAAESTIWAAQAYVDSSDQAGVTVQMALKNGGGIRNSIVGPPVTFLLVKNALLFDNKLTVVEISAEGLLAALENAVSRYPSADGRFPQLAGLRVTFDPSQLGVEGQPTLSTPSRVIELDHVDSEGNVVDTIVSAGVLQGDATRTFVLATNDFLTAGPGGDGYASLAASKNLATTVLGEQQILKDYIVSELGGSLDFPDPPTPANIIQA